MPSPLVRAAAALGLAALAVGCDTGPKIVPVSGRVLIDGKPLTTGVVRVMPADFRAASGRIGPDGRFTLTTRAANDGCVVGTHAVTVIANETLGAAAQKWHAPRKYVEAATSGLTVTVDGPTDALTINLSWDGGKPFLERFSGD